MSVGISTEYSEKQLSKLQLIAHIAHTQRSQPFEFPVLMLFSVPRKFYSTIFVKVTVHSPEMIKLSTRFNFQSCYSIYT